MSWPASDDGARRNLFVVVGAGFIPTCAGRFGRLAVPMTEFWTTFFRILTVIALLGAMAAHSRLDKIDKP